MHTGAACKSSSGSIPMWRFGRSVSNDAPLTPAQLAEQLAFNAKAAAEDGALFVQSYR